MSPSNLPRILFILPHPDDESFPVGGTIAKYSHSGAAEVYLYTLTRGEASRNAGYHGISGDDIASIRVREVRTAADILGVLEHQQGLWPDGKLRDLDPRVLEEDFAGVILRVRPNVLVTFDVQGGSVHPDHIVTHHIVKRLYCALREEHPWLKRLAFFGIPHDRVTHWPRKVFGLPSDRIHAVINVGAYHAIELAAIRAHESVRRDVEENNFENWMLWDEEYYTFFQETIAPPVDDLLSGLSFP